MFFIFALLNFYYYICRPWKYDNRAMGDCSFTGCWI